MDAVAIFDPIYGTYKDFAFELLNRQIDFINTFDCPEDNRVINLRFICYPDPVNYRRGKIDSGIIVRLPDEDKNRSIGKAQKVFKDVWATITSISDNYEFEPITDAHEFLRFFDPFKIESIVEIFRREDVIEIETANRVRGFRKKEVSFSLDNGGDREIYYVYPFIWGMNSLSKAFKSMLYQHVPSMLSIILKPIEFTPELESLLSKEIEQVEKRRHSLGDESAVLLDSISKTLHNQLLRLEDSPFYLKILVATAGPFSKGLIDSFGVEMTEHAGSPDMVRDANEAYVLSGGYRWYAFDGEMEKEKVIEELRWLNINFTAPTVAPEYYKRIRYLFDSSQANCAFRFPVPQPREIPGIKSKYYKSVLPPPHLPEEGIILGYSKREGLTQEIRINRDDRRRHMYIVGQTGTGKTTILQNMILQDIENNDGLTVLDPHGELIDEVLHRLPEQRIKDLIYINFEDIERPVTLNMLECKTELEKDMCVQQLFEIFEKLYDLKIAGGPMFEMYMKNALLLLLEDTASDPTLLEVQRVFSDRGFRNYKISKAKNQFVVDFWEKIAKDVKGESSLENIAPYIISKLSMFIYNNTVRNIVASQRSTIDFRKVMDESKILLVNLGKGKIGAINSHFLGMVIVNKLLIAALGRSDVEDKHSLRDFYLYIDEFQNLATNSFITLLSEARKYKLNAILANQYLTQIPDEVLRAIFGNVGSIVSFRPGITDSEILEREFYPSFTKNDIMNLPNWSTCVKTLAKGEVLMPFEMKTFPAKNIKDLNIKRKVIEQSRELYGRNVQVIEKEISERYKIIYADKPN